MAQDSSPPQTRLSDFVQNMSEAERKGLARHREDEGDYSPEVIFERTGLTLRKVERARKKPSKFLSAWETKTRGTDYYKSLEEFLNQLFFVNGNGYTWNKGELSEACISDSPACVYDSETEEILERSQVWKQIPVHDFKSESFYPICEYAKIVKIPEDVEISYFATILFLLKNTKPENFREEHRQHSSEFLGTAKKQASAILSRRFSNGTQEKELVEAIRVINEGYIEDLKEPPFERKKREMVEAVNDAIDSRDLERNLANELSEKQAKAVLKRKIKEMTKGISSRMTEAVTLLREKGFTEKSPCDFNDMDNAMFLVERDGNVGVCITDQNSRYIFTINQDNGWEVYRYFDELDEEEAEFSDGENYVGLSGIVAKLAEVNSQKDAKALKKMLLSLAQQFEDYSNSEEADYFSRPSLQYFIVNGVQRAERDQYSIYPNLCSDLNFSNDHLLRGFVNNFDGVKRIVNLFNYSLDQVKFESD